METIVEEVTDVEKPKSIMGIRHLQVLMLFLAMMVALGMRANMSIALVAMTDPDNDNSFDWSASIQNVIISSFFWGYGFLQIPAGEVSARFGGKVVIILCIIINSIITLLLPTSAYNGDWKSLRTCRILLGLSQGFLYPSVNNLISKWVPLDERNRLGTLIYSGAHLGTAVQLMASGFVADNWGWPAIFYVNGTLGLIWTAIYLFLGSSSPKTSTIISDKERIYIQTSLGHTGEEKILPTPWKASIFSLPFNALILVHSGHEFGFWTLMTQIPIYMTQVLGVDITANGLMSALPYMVIFIMSFPFGFLSDFALKKKWFSITVIRKLSSSIGMYGPAIILIGLAYAPADVKIVLLLLALAAGLNAGHYTGILLAHLDIAPNFAGTLMGVTDYISSNMGTMAPKVAGSLLKDETEPREWRKVFFVASAIYVATNTFYVAFGSCETQKWNEPKPKPDDNGKSSY
ncbi:putative inorganic phosphate cotransporter [Achroia grisella]|uniref:putative inorganic phosphate cotransporter n=1 Tax=Achroia grisella TaxID=688607 RepID=UPI0027D33949|nr:putative inorganic phosphate cotransporter [Achroia grisella]